MSEFKERVYNTRYLKKVFMNKILKFIETKGVGVHDIYTWTCIPKNYDVEFIVMDDDDAYNEMTDIFKENIKKIEEIIKQIKNPSITIGFGEISSEWIFLIREGYEEDLKFIKKKLREENKKEKYIEELLGLGIYNINENEDDYYKGE